ncbi:DUF4214 domain-containing protein [Pengzhenrongella sp.]|jgi:hypothetical protein|uniref:DUF4214 domain-containing protein n=1 Tax=Pengzhenrongella sp. TaxID=2888820 RepID=UPI002F92BBBC
MGARQVKHSASRTWIGGLALLGLIVPLAAGVSITAASPARAVAGTQTDPGFLTEVGPNGTANGPFAVTPLNPPGQPALTMAAGGMWSTPAYGDVTGDGIPEIIVGGGLSSLLRVYDITGHLVVPAVDVGGVNLVKKSGGINASPALIDVNLDGVLDVVIATTSNRIASYSFKNGVTTRLMVRQDAAIVPNGPNGMIATPALGYLNSDATPDMVTGSWGQALNANSTLTGNVVTGWPKWLKDTIWSSPAIGDIDDDGAKDVVVGGDCAGNDIGTQPCGNVGGGYVWAYNRNGSEKWHYFLQGQVVWSSPALADLNGDGAQDVVVGSGGYFPEPGGRVITALNGKTGKVLWQAATPARVTGSPSLGDVTGDGKPDVFIVTYGGWLMGYNGATGARLWNSYKCITDSEVCGNVGIGTLTGVALADLDNDGHLEAVTQGEGRLRVYDARTGDLKFAKHSAYSGTIYAPGNTPTIVQVNGRSWVIEQVRGKSQAGDAQLVVTVWKTNTALGRAPWPTFKGNFKRTGAAAVPGVSVPASQAFVRSMYRDFLNREATAPELALRTTQLTERMLTRREMTSELSRSDEWISTVITQFYLDTLGRTPDAGGLAGWVDAARSGMPIARIAAAFYASSEYFTATGHSNYTTWVNDLYLKLLNRTPDAGGVSGWVGALNGGMSRLTVAYAMYQSNEMLHVRVDALYQDLLNRPADAGSETWIPFVKSAGDLVLAASLVASAEYYSKATF